MTPRPARGGGWLWLLLAGMFEIGFTTSLKLQQHDGRFLALFLICAVLSFQCLGAAIKTLPLSVAYALWTGIGAVGTVIVGATVFGEGLSPLRALVLAGLIATLLGLKLATLDAASGKRPTTPQSAPGEERSAGGTGEL